MKAVKKYLLIGYGSIGQRHARLLSSYSMIQIDVVSKHYDNAKYRNIEDVIVLNEYDVFIISSETVKHFHQLEYINRNVEGKLILVEKPIFENSDYSINLMNKVIVAYNLRFLPIFQEVIKIVQAQKPLSVNVFAGSYLPNWRPEQDYRKSYSSHASRGGGVLLDLSHEIDYIQWLFGIINVDYSYVGLLSDFDISSEDFATFSGTTIKSTVVNVTLDYFSKIPERKIIINTNENTIHIDLVCQCLKIKDRSGKLLEKHFEIERDLSYRNMHEALLNGEYSNFCQYDEAIEVLKTVKRIKENNKHEKN